MRPASDRDTERRRRRLLDESDRLLDEVELLRLSDRRSLPKPLREEIERFQVSLGRGESTVSLATLRSAHDVVLALQSTLMARNPRNLTPHSHPNRAHGQAMMRVLDGGTRWKLLSLPAPGGLEHEEWRSLLEATLARALDRWAYAQHHAAAACRDQSGAARSLARARTAWGNYWELRQEAERLFGELPGADSL